MVRQRENPLGIFQIKASPWLVKLIVLAVVGGGGVVGGRTLFVAEKIDNKVEDASVVVDANASRIDVNGKRISALEAAAVERDRDLIRRPEYEKDQAATNDRLDSMDDKLDLIIQLQQRSDETPSGRSRNNPPRQ